MSAAAHVAELFEGGVPAVVHVGEGLFETAEVFDWIKAAHPPTSMARLKLEALLGKSADRSGPDPGRPAELYRQGGTLLDPSPYLPRTTETFDGWVERVREALGPFGIQAAGLECASWDALHRLQTLLHPVLSVTGPRTYRYNAFAGDYRRTPFGFHIDPHQEAVFQYIVHGRRRALFWHGLALAEADLAWVEDTNGLVDAPRKPEFAFDVGPGDLVFWPGTYVHGMEPEGPSLGLSMVIDRASPGAHAEVSSKLRIATAGGRSALPQVDEAAAVRPGQTLRRRSAYPLRYERFDDLLVVGVCGRAFDWPDAPSIADAPPLLDALNASEELSVDALIEAHADGALDAELICEILSGIAGLGFFQ